MHITDPIADMLTRIRNANNAKHDTVDVPASNMKKAIAQILLEEGYIKNFQLIDDGTQGVIRITLKYNAGKEKVLSGLRRVSKPGLRVYAGADELPRVLRGLARHFHPARADAHPADAKVRARIKQRNALKRVGVSPAHKSPADQADADGFHNVFLRPIPFFHHYIRSFCRMQDPIFSGFAQILRQCLTFDFDCDRINFVLKTITSAHIFGLGRAL